MENNPFIASEPKDRNNTSWGNRADLAIAHGALTNSKRPSCFVKGVYPTHLARGLGVELFDTSGKRYVDFICGLGTNLIGYADGEIATAIYDRALKGASLSLSSTVEVEAAEKMKEVFPYLDRVRFLKTGSEACSAAIRIARAVTGRHMILSEHYHGWHDAFVSLTPPALGVPHHQEIAPLTRRADVYPESVAAIIVEPISTDASTKRIHELIELREWCDKHGALLIFDEVITGFRHPKHSASVHYGVKADLSCFGKAMGNGMPIAAVGGSKAVMEGADYFVSSSYAGETLSLAAAIKTMTLLQTKYDIQHLWEKGAYFIERFNKLYPEALTIEGYATRGVFKGNDMTKALFFQESCKAGMLFGPSFFVAFPHMALFDQILENCRDILLNIKLGRVRLEGEMPKTPYAQKVRNQ